MLPDAIRSDDAAYFVWRLLKRGASSNAPDFTGTTPLVEAVLCRKPDIVEMLLKNGADPDKPKQAVHSPYLLPSQYDGRTALQIATETKSEEIAALLRKAGAKE